MSKKVFIGCDHTGTELKALIMEIVAREGFSVQELQMEEDYIDIAKKVATSVYETEESIGILICGSGVGVSIVANKQIGIRAALCHNALTAKLSRCHNNANVLCLGARILQPLEQINIVKTFLTTNFEDGGRHKIRINKIEYSKS